MERKEICRCRCPCHDNEDDENLIDLEHEYNRKCDDGMTWAQGAIRTSPTGCKTTYPHPDQHFPFGENWSICKPPNSNPFKVNCKPPKAHEALSRSFVHVKNMVRTMTAKWEAMCEAEGGLQPGLNRNLSEGNGNCADQNSYSCQRNPNVPKEPSCPRKVSFDGDNQLQSTDPGRKNFCGEDDDSYSFHPTNPFRVDELNRLEESIPPPPPLPPPRLPCDIRGTRRYHCAELHEKLNILDPCGKPCSPKPPPTSSRAGECGCLEENEDVCEAYSPSPQCSASSSSNRIECNEEVEEEYCSSEGNRKSVDSTEENCCHLPEPEMGIRLEDEYCSPGQSLSNELAKKVRKYDGDDVDVCRKVKEYERWSDDDCGRKNKKEEYHGWSDDDCEQKQENYHQRKDDCGRKNREENCIENKDVMEVAVQTSLQSCRKEIQPTLKRPCEREPKCWTPPKSKHCCKKESCDNEEKAKCWTPPKSKPCCKKHSSDTEENAKCWTPPKSNHCFKNDHPEKETKANKGWTPPKSKHCCKKDSSDNDEKAKCWTPPKSDDCCDNNYPDCEEKTKRWTPPKSKHCCKKDSSDNDEKTKCWTPTKLDDCCENNPTDYEVKAKSWTPPKSKHSCKKDPSANNSEERSGCEMNSNSYEQKCGRERRSSPGEKNRGRKCVQYSRCESDEQQGTLMSSCRDDQVSAYQAWISVSDNGDDQEEISSGDMEVTISIGDTCTDEGFDSDDRTVVAARTNSCCRAKKVTKCDQILANLSRNYDCMQVIGPLVQVEPIGRSVSVTNQHQTGKNTVCPNKRRSSEKKEKKNMIMYSSIQVQYCICPKCEKIVDTNERAFRLPGLSSSSAWHPDCFKCKICTKQLSEKNHGFYEDQPYCLEHYEEFTRINPPTCSRCQETILDSSYTSAGGDTWHKDHFTCHGCNKPLTDTKYVLVPGHLPYCFPCHEESFPKHCKSCQCRIFPQEPYVNVNPADSGTQQAYWHSSQTCLTCATCGQGLVGRPLFFRKDNGLLYCNRYCAVH